MGWIGVSPRQGFGVEFPCEAGPWIPVKAVKYGVVPLVLKQLSQHFMVPKHEVVPQDKAPEVLKAFHATNEKIPQILANDPVIEEIGAKRGDIVKITRHSPTAGRSVYYRIVV
ncbi:MAG: DNA-directed RNA polymerase subunit H [Candidatus Diapherotrites archaeon]|uniref:DNA-directed RNA polymerase subunit Rpo5 n=1 Tax=Candidatus Iainarchaeum sp. TaxID=3101447 RepID=A0A8T4L907_9ARCH|nr:DNA-directed RNA polymerase subunit H [Candidatus Diapherotrites archaeon]